MGKSLNPISGIYKIENKINGKVYVGQSQDIERRIKTHKTLLQNHKHYNEHLQRSVEKYGIDAFTFDVVELCSTDALDDREMYYIKQYNAKDNGYNNNDGGGGLRGYSFSAESRRKMSMNHSDMSGSNNPMYGKKLADVMGQERYDEFVRRSHNARVGVGKMKAGVRYDEETRARMSDGRKRYLEAHGPRRGYNLSDETKQKISDSNRKRHAENPELYYTRPVVLLNTGEHFESINSACAKYNVNASSITTCCNKGTLSAGTNEDGKKLVWVSEEEFNRMSDDDVSSALDRAQSAKIGRNNPNAKKVRCVETGEVFDTMKQAGEKMKVDVSGICGCCAGRYKSAGKDSVTGNPLHWEYAN